MSVGFNFGWLWALLAIALNALASTLLKLASGGSIASLFAPDNQRALFLLAGAITAYGCAFVSYFMTLRYLPLGIAYILITAGASIVIALVSVLLLNERLVWIQVLGFALSISGLYLIVASPSLATH